MKRTMVWLMISLWVAAGIWGEDSQEEKRRHRIVNLSLAYPVSLNRNPSDTANVSLSLFYGRLGTVRGFDLSGLTTRIEDQLTGMQVAGLGAMVGGSVRGWQMSGVFSVSGEKVMGGQVAGVFSVAGNDLLGLQLAGVFSVSGKTMRGLQAAGVFNVSGSDVTGVQLAGVFNVAGGKCLGLQLATINVASVLKGGQIGVVNAAGSSHGFQIGVINYCQKENLGVPFGLINLARNGRIRVRLWGGSDIALNAGIKFQVNRFYSLLSAGTLNTGKNEVSMISRSWAYGIHFPLGRAFIDSQLGYQYLDYKDFFRRQKGRQDEHAIEARGILGYKMLPGVSLLLGGGIGYGFEVGKRLDTGKWKPIFMIGLELL